MIAGPKEASKDVKLRFPISGDWHKAIHKIGKKMLHKNELFLAHYQKLPESILASSFNIQHKLKFKLDHEGVLVSKGST